MAEGIDLALGRDYLDISEPLLVEIKTKVQNLPEPPSCSSTYGADVLSSLRHLLDDWVHLRQRIEWVIDQLEVNPHLEPLIWNPYSTDHYIITVGTDDKKISRDDLSDEDARILIVNDPSFFLGSINGIEDSERETARNNWWRSVREDTSIAEIKYEMEITMGINLKIFRFEISQEIDARVSEMADGTVEVSIASYGNIAAGISSKSKTVTATGGIEGGIENIYSFANMQAANRFLAKLRSAALNPVSAVEILLDERYMTGLVVSVGVLGELEAEFPKFKDSELFLSAKAGYKRDFISDEDILLFEAEAEVEVDLPGRLLEGQARIEFEGEYRRSAEGSYVELDLALEAEVAAEMDVFSELGLGELDLSAGGRVTASVKLVLDDPAAVEAWESFLNPLDLSLNLTDLFRESEVIVQILSRSKTEVIDVDVKLIDIEGELTTTNAITTWVKPQQGQFEVMR